MVVVSDYISRQGNLKREMLYNSTYIWRGASYLFLWIASIYLQLYEGKVMALIVRSKMFLWVYTQLIPSSFGVLQFGAEIGMDVVILKKEIPEYRLQLHALLPQESSVFIILLIYTLLLSPSGREIWDLCLYFHSFLFSLSFQLLPSFFLSLSSSQQMCTEF